MEHGMEQDSARGASAFLLIPPINAQRAMGPGTAVWHVGLFYSRFLASSTLLDKVSVWYLIPRW